RIKPAHSDQPAVKRDRKYRLAAGFIDRGEECHSVRGAIGMRDTRGVLGDAAVAGQSHHGRYVAVRRRTQRKPRGFARGHATRLGVWLSVHLGLSRQDVPSIQTLRLPLRMSSPGLLKTPLKPKGETGMPVSPFGAHSGPPVRLHAGGPPMI